HLIDGGGANQPGAIRIRARDRRRSVGGRFENISSGRPDRKEEAVRVRFIKEILTAGRKTNFAVAEKFGRRAMKFAIERPAFSEIVVMRAIAKRFIGWWKNVFARTAETVAAGAAAEWTAHIRGERSDAA